MRGLAHGLGSAGQTDLAFSEDDALCRVDHRLEARATQPVERQRRHFDRQTGPESDMARQVDRIGRALDDVAEKDVVEGFGINTRPIDGRLRGDSAELRRRMVLQATAEGPKRRSHGRQEHDVPVTPHCPHYAKPFSVYGRLPCDFGE